MSLPRVELLADHSETSWITDLVVALRPWSRPLAPHPETPLPDAYLAVSPRAPRLAEALRSAIPVAVVVDDPAPTDTTLTDATLTDATLTNADAIVVRDAHAAVQVPNAILWPRDAVDAGRHPCVPPFVRQRWRTALGLPDPWIVAFDGHGATALDSDLHATALALCSVAIITGPGLVTALSLGAPVVTSPAAAERVGAEPDVHLLTRSNDHHGAAASLANDVARAAALSWGGRTLVEERFDLRTVAIALLDQLGIGPAPFPIAPLAGLDTELAALGTPASSATANRVIRRVATLMPGVDWADLTGRRR